MTSKKTQDASSAAALEQLVSMNEIRESEENGRIHYDEAQLKDLAQSIKSQDLHEPVVLRRLAEGGYELVDGHRRYRAHQRLGRTDIKANVRDMTIEQARMHRVATMFQRVGGTPYEEARYLAAALKNPGMTRSKLSAECGIKPGTMKNRLELLEFPEEVAIRVGVDGFSMEHARVLGALAKSPPALEAALILTNERIKADTLPTVPQFFEAIKKQLVKADLARDPSDWRYNEISRELPTFEGQATKLDHLTHKAPYGETTLVLDVEGFDNLVEKAKGTLERRKEKAAKDPETVQRAAAEANARKERDLEREARKNAATARSEAGWKRFAEIESPSTADLAVVLLDGLDAGFNEDDAQPMSDRTGIAADTIRELYAWKGEGNPLELAVFKIEAPALIRLILALSVDRHLHQNEPAMLAHWSGKTANEWIESSRPAKPVAEVASSST